ncbi:hypothetical protein BFW01_g77 [Lasiodiplodia theobromae]|uniref:Uncharacterized protein n=1 Tax=Lasiodiplodia theobromae TaxID=45133 RepID=A0A5N5D9F4_9PEZI|nr:Prenylated rab acceptor 1 [Lasiodiplodia theobromae]KAB2574398.1 hypothetical protein DBV05_g6920 [Lasiodiplodia theobromae]KAF4534868.1 Prenylated rab acceptor 1 [Lasiodiplodia theobromae]KAF9629896.1 hypothetical protein BFW01_g77 [Lasiodiplodia theobromae]
MGRNGIPYGARLQELGDSDEDEFSAGGLRGQGGVFLDPMVQKGGPGRAASSDALYYDGIDPRWNARGGIDYDNAVYRPAFEDDYYGVRLNPDEEELLVQRALDRIRIARSRGQPNVNLSHEELEALARPHIQQSPKPPDLASARPSSKGRPSSSSNNNSSTRSKKSSSRPSLFSSSPRSSRPRSGKSDSNRRNSSAHESEASSAAPPGLRIPGAGAAPLGYASHPTPHPGSRSASGAYHATAIGREWADPFYDPATRDYARPSSRDSIGLTPAEEAEYLARRANRSRSGSSAPGYPPPPPYPTYGFERERGRPSDADPFMYQTGGPPPGLYARSSASSSPSSQRRAVFGSSVALPPAGEGVAYTAVPRRVPVPPGAVSAASSSRLNDLAGLGHASISDPTLGYKARGGQRNRPLEVEVEYDPPSASGSSGESDGVHQGVRIHDANLGPRIGVGGRAKELEREANATGRSGSGSGNGSGRKRKGKRR